MKKKLITGALALSVGISGFVLSTPAHAKKAEPFPECSSKLQVAVDRFKTENISIGWWNDDVALNSREVAVDELVQSGCFTVLEREEGSMAPTGVMNEKILARSDEAAPGSKAAKKRKMKVAENLVSFALTGAKKDGSGFGIGGAGGAGGGLGGLGLGVKQSELNLSCKVINTSTSEILASSRVTTKGTSFGIDAGGGGLGAGKFGVGGVSFFKDSKVGKMMSDAIHQCTVNLAKSVAR